MRYIIPGNPVALQRPRFNQGQKRPWDPQKKIKEQFAFIIRAQNKISLMYQGPLEIDITFFMGHKKKNGYHSSVPDLDNMIKFLQDVAQGILFENDSLIASIKARKVYDENPRTEFTIRELIF